MQRHLRDQVGERLGGGVQVGVFPVDWNKFLQRIPAGAEPERIPRATKRALQLLIKKYVEC